MHNPETLIVVTLVIGGYCVLYAIPMLWAIRSRERERERGTERRQAVDE